MKLKHLVIVPFLPGLCWRTTRAAVRCLQHRRGRARRGRRRCTAGCRSPASPTRSSSVSSPQRFAAHVRDVHAKNKIKNPQFKYLYDEPVSEKLSLHDFLVLTWS